MEKQLKHTASETKEWYPRDTKVRCINLDWLELYCIEDYESSPMNAEFFRSKMWQVSVRDYGTRQYREMFTLCDKDGLPFLEIRRSPVSADESTTSRGIFDPLSCHIRLSNRYCYHPEAIALVTKFLHDYKYTTRRLYRLDLALDFETFDSGDDPKKFIVRYLKGVYTKINQGNVSAHGKDFWESRQWNSLSWGALSSMVSTKLYCKTMELQEAKDKPYIRYAWQVAGLVDDYVTLQKRAADGTIYHPAIWRVEFSIKSSASAWVMVEDCNGKHNKRVAVDHTLATYATKDDQLKAFARLAYHYFHFKHYQEGVRKDRCKDKPLFVFSPSDQPYKLDRLLSDRQPDNALIALEKRLVMFRMLNPSDKIRDAVNLLLDEINTLKIRGTLVDYYDRSEANLLKLIIQRKMGSDADQRPYDEVKRDVAAMLDVCDELF